MGHYRFFEMAFALCFGLTFALVDWWEIAGPIWHLEWTGSDEQWLNVASATLIGCAILVAGVSSLFGADGMLRRERVCDDCQPSGRLSRASSEDDSRWRGTDDPLRTSRHVEGVPLYPDDSSVHHERDWTNPGRELKHIAGVADE
jgi:hypothetical protein